MTYKPNGENVSNTIQLPEFMRPVLYNRCLRASSYLMTACRHLKDHHLIDRPLNTQIMESSCHMFINYMNHVLFMLCIKQNATPDQILFDENAEDAVIALITMSADGINPMRTSPTDEELSKLVTTVYAYAVDRHAKYTAINKSQTTEGA